MTARAEGPDVRVSGIPGGPLLVRGAERVVDAQGERHDVRRPVVALCRCEGSARQPWCDGTHKALPADRR